MEGTLLNPNPQFFRHLHRNINTKYFVTIVNCQSDLTTGLRYREQSKFETSEIKTVTTSRCSVI